MNYRERFDSWRESCCHSCLGDYESQTKIGMCLKTKKKKKLTKKRILPIAKRDGIISILPLLEVIGSLVGDTAGIAKAINDNKTVQRQLDELKHHNRVMEGHGVYLVPYKHGQGVSTKKIKKRLKKNSKETIKMPKGITINIYCNN